MSSIPFFERSVQIVRDLSVDEQWYLYDKARQLKEILQNRQDPSSFKISDPNLGVYLMFLEDSTRTKESFRNASIFHGLKVNDFDVKSSSFQKKESITDTVKMLLGYSQRSLFIIRSRQEGVCRWLEQSMVKYAEKARLDTPIFINAGDGRHEHPTQEFLDEFSFLEYYKWSRDHIHIALVGDLFHGRTVHSKVEGLKVFNHVEVDLIAPEAIAMPKFYIEGMKAAGYKIRIFESIAEYVSQKKIAPIWYFTRLQLERMGEQVLGQTERLREAVTFSKDFLDIIPPTTRFFHPLPRHSEAPGIPSFLDDTEFNAWDEQSRNGYFTRITLISMLAGKLGLDFKGKSPIIPEFPDDFVDEAPLRGEQTKQEYKVGIRPVDNGMVIDHLGTGMSPREIWELIHKVRNILDLNLVSSQGVYTSEKKNHHKGVISIPDLTELDDKRIKMLAAISPQCTLNIVKDSHVVKKYRLSMPPRVYKLEGLCCRNEDCISHPKSFEPVIPEFIRDRSDTFICRYCESPHKYRELFSGYV